MILKQMGQKIRKLRMEQKISQEELSYRSQLHRNYISDAERGTRNISLKALAKFAKGLNTTLETLFKDIK